ncbi:MAG: hypothetical protein IJW40_08350, partial [Clostridia bacterium]|nr:hypothetical protein [Clostridia bacterium]
CVYTKFLKVPRKLFEKSFLGGAWGSAPPSMRMPSATKGVAPWNPTKTFLERKVLDSKEL